ncbi:MAG TPA: hypothetical protein VFK85_12805, partial [Anaeromyxobacteraceae bacterium]|nr:hypothetical protein [Anaeromyxobacteraceae bacterium]
MLAPVLARLSEIPGVTDARVECSGSWFFVDAQSAAALDRALPAVRDALGPGATLADGVAREAQLARRSQGELWFSRDDIRALSYVEGRVLATRMTDAVTAAVTLDGSAREQVAEATRAEIFAALDHAHDTGGRASSGWFWEEWPRIVDRIASRRARA